MKSNKPSRVLAWITIAVIIAVIIFLFYCAITGTNFLGSMYLIIVVPVIIWAVMFFAGCFSHKNDDENDNEHNDSNN